MSIHTDLNLTMGEEQLDSLAASLKTTIQDIKETHTNLSNVSFRMRQDLKEGKCDDWEEQFIQHVKRLIGTLHSELTRLAALTRSECSLIVLFQDSSDQLDGGHEKFAASLSECFTCLKQLEIACDNLWQADNDVAPVSSLDISKSKL